MKHPSYVLPFTHHLLPIFIIIFIPWSVSKERFIDVKEETPEMFEAFNEPSSEYELYRRRITKNLIGFWHLFSSELNKMKKEVERKLPEMTHRIGSVIDLGDEFMSATLSDLDRLRLTDGHATWREREAAELSELMQRRLIRLQNPKNCNTARKALISLHKSGLGSQLHSLVYRFIIAYATNRTVFFDSRGWCYNPGGWEGFFSPFSDTCTVFNGSSRSDWAMQPDWPDWSRTQADIVYIPFHPVFPLAPFFPQTLPTDLAPRLRRLHGNPFAWWVGQFFKYILRPRSEMAKIVEEIAELREFQRPIVGVHIRRSDKITEVHDRFSTVDEYMAEVDKYYQVLEFSEDVPIRHVYLATDDPRVIAEMEEKYENRYQIFSNRAIAVVASSIKMRCNNKSLIGIITDIFFLSLSDYVVCTFSSNVCRTVYEIMQIFHPDASDKLYSMDKRYFYDFELEGRIVADYPHYVGNPGDLSFDVGDEVTEIQDLGNGYTTGLHLRSKRVGWFPSFKVHETWNTYDFPTYPES